jgi:hypothetical protein
MLIKVTGWVKALAQVTELQVNKNLLFTCHKLFSNAEVLWSKFTNLEFREQLVCDLVLAVEDMAVNIKGIQ